jgi:hypothetical protein
VVASDISGVPGRQMLAAMRGKITALQEAFTGFFTGHHAFLLQRMLARAGAIDADIAALDAKIEDMTAPFTARWSGWMRSPASTPASHR